MTLQLAEGVVSAYANYFALNQGAKFAALNAEFGDGITLAQWTTVSLYEKVEIEPSLFPWLEVLAAGGSVDTENAMLTTTKHTMALVCWLMDDTSVEVLRRRVMRTHRALFEMVKDSRTDASMTGYNVSRVGQWQFNTWKRPESRVVANLIMQLDVTINAAYP